jgi:5-methylcytosine-specific restriction endonuclease McrA
MVLLLRGKAEVIENGRGMMRSIEGAFDIPSVIRVVYFIKRPLLQRKMTKVEVFSRDKYICQYCGTVVKDLTIDHVIPKRSGGLHCWENVVTACIPCNRRKAGRTPGEAGMPLLKEPRAPFKKNYYIPFYYLHTHVEWNKYFRQ